VWEDDVATAPSVICAVAAHGRSPFAVVRAPERATASFPSSGSLHNYQIGRDSFRRVLYRVSSFNHQVRRTQRHLAECRMVRSPELLRASLEHSPYLSQSGDSSKDSSLRDPGCGRPLIERGFHPLWNRHGADVSALPDYVHYCPVSLAHLDLIQFQPTSSDLRKPQPNSMASIA
jgi:hypothetical protein